MELLSRLQTIPAPVVADGRIYVTSIDGYISALNANPQSEDGELLWTAEVDGRMFDSPQILDGILYVSTTAGNVYTFADNSKLTFNAEGQQEGASWSVTFDGITQTSTSDSIQFVVCPSGQYSYSITAPTGYSSTPSSGTLTLSGDDITRTISFSPGSTYTVTFTESGLATGTSWTVSFNGEEKSSTTDTITFTAPQGTYDYTLIAPDGYRLRTDNTDSITVNNNDVEVSIPYQPVYYLIEEVYINNQFAGKHLEPYPVGQTANINLGELPPGYTFDHAIADGERSLDTSFTFVMDQNHTLQGYLNYGSETFQLSINSATGGTTDPASGEHSYSSGDTATVSATPDEGYSFSHWILDGENAGTDTTIDVDMSTNHELTPVFTENTPPPSPSIISYQLTINSATGGTTNIGEGVHIYNSGNIATVTATTSTGYQFSYWLLDGAINSAGATINVIMNTYHTLTPVFTPINTQLTINSATGGSTNPEAGTYNYNYGSEISIIANTTAGYSFEHWLLNGQVNSTNPTMTLTMTLNYTLTPIFNQNTYTLTVNSAVGGSTTPDNGSHNYLYGENVIATATASEGYSFDHWLLANQTVSTSSISIQMTANHTLTPVFTPITCTLTVSSTAGGLTAPASGTQTYIYGQTATVSASPTDGYRFTNWILDGQNATADNTISIQMTSNHTITAAFTEIPVVLIATETTTNTNTTYPTTYSIEITGGNITAKQMTNMTITPYSSNTTTVVALNVTGPSGTMGTGTIALPKDSIPYGSIPQVYIDGVITENQTYTEDGNYFYVTFTTHFSTHTISIVFTSPAPPPTPTPTPTATPTATASTSPSPSPSSSPTPTATAHPTTAPSSTATPTSTPNITPTTTPSIITQGALNSYTVVGIAVILLILVVLTIAVKRKKKEK